MGAFIPRRQQVAVCSKEHVAPYKKLGISYTRGKVTETRGRKKVKNKSGNWEDLWSNEIFQNKSNSTEQLQNLTLPSLLPGV